MLIFIENKFGKSPKLSLHTNAHYSTFVSCRKFGRKLKLTGHEKARFLFQSFKNTSYENDENLAGGAGDGLCCGGVGAGVDEIL
ncbi:MAG: hypothetical protein MUC59_11500 [Saprospiraceae bacterium]|jgi:hypothetical protein|nr:hypothetical protein [Saprospiraceae bacterium]